MVGGQRRETGDGRRETGDGRRETGEARGKTGDGRRKRPLCLVECWTTTGHLYQLIHYRDRFAVPPSFRKALANRAIAKVHQTKPSGTARKSISQPTSILQPTSQAVSCRSITKALCAVLAPRRMRAAFFAYFLLLLTKSRSPKASEATNNAVGPNALEKRATSVLMGVVSFNLRSISLVQMPRRIVPTMPFLFFFNDTTA